MFDSCWIASVDVSDSNEYCFTKMVNARKHGMFYQHLKKLLQYNKRINALPSVTPFGRWEVFTCGRTQTSRYARRYVNRSFQ